MSAVVDFVSDVVGGVVEAVGDVVEGVVDVVKDVGSAIDDYVIQPILDDPLTAIATMAGATFLGPAIAPMLGTGLGAATGYVATGLGAAAGNTAAGLAQGEDFDEAIKGGLVAGVTAGATTAGFDYLTGGGAFSPTASQEFPLSSAAAPDEALASAAATPDEFVSGAQTSPDVDIPEPTVTSELDNFFTRDPQFVADDFLTKTSDDVLSSPTLKGTTSTAASTVDDPLYEFLKDIPGALDDTAITAPSVAGPGAPPRDWLLEGVKFPDTSGINAPKIAADAPLNYNLDGSINYDLMAGVPKQQLIGFRPDGGQGLQVGVEALPDFTYSMDSIDPAIRGMGDTWVGESGKLYGVGTPEGIITEAGFQPLSNLPTLSSTTTTAADAATSGAGKTLGDKLKNFEFSDISLTDVGKAAMNYAVENPLTTLAAATLATGVLSGAGGPPAGAGGPPPGGGTKDENFNKPLDYYNYLRDLQQYQGDLTKYGERPGEHRFFVNTRFEPVPIPTTPPPGSKHGGLIQYKQHLAAGGMANDQIAGPQMPSGAQQVQNAMSQREAMMAAMQQRAAMAKRQGALAQMQGGGQGMPQGAPAGMPQGMQGGMPQGMQGGMPQQPMRRGPVNRNPKTSYYQYGTPPAMAMGGLNMVRSMNVGGGADGRSDDVDALLSDGEYVIDAETVAMLGNGSSEAGASRLDQMRSNVRKHKGKNLSKGKISPDAKSPLAYLKGA